MRQLPHTTSLRHEVHLDTKLPRYQASSRCTLLVLLALDQCGAIAHGYLASVITVRALLVKLVV